MVTKLEYEIFVISGTQGSLYAQGLTGQSSYIGTSYFSAERDGIPKAGEEYVIEIRFVLSEDMPSDLFRSRSPKYRELWTRTIKSDVL